MYSADPSSTEVHDAPVTVVSRTVPAGSYVINAKANLNNGSAEGATSASCSLYAGEAFLDATGGLGLSGFTTANSIEIIALQGVVSNFAGGTLRIDCDARYGTRSLIVVRPVLTAIKVSTIH